MTTALAAAERQLEQIDADAGRQRDSPRPVGDAALKPGRWSSMSSGCCPWPLAGPAAGAGAAEQAGQAVRRRGQGVPAAAAGPGRRPRGGRAAGGRSCRPRNCRGGSRAGPGLRAAVLPWLRPGWWRLRAVLHRAYDFRTHAVRPKWSQVLAVLEHEYAAEAALDQQRGELAAAYASKATSTPGSQLVAELQQTLPSLPAGLARTVAALLKDADSLPVIERVRGRGRTAGGTGRGAGRDLPPGTPRSAGGAAGPSCGGWTRPWTSCRRSCGAWPRSAPCRSRWAGAFCTLPLTPAQLEAALADRSWGEARPRRAAWCRASAARRGTATPNGSSGCTTAGSKATPPKSAAASNAASWRTSADVEPAGQPAERRPEGIQTAATAAGAASWNTSSARRCGSSRSATWSSGDIGRGPAGPEAGLADEPAERVRHAAAGHATASTW